MAFIVLCIAGVACSKQADKEPIGVVHVPLCINEVFAAGASGDATEGIKGDWLELYNAGSALQLGSGEWFLTDDRDELVKFELPGISLAQQGHLRIWCDGTDGTEVHANFRLSSKGEWLALVHLAQGRSYIVDSIRYAPQHGIRGLTASRYPDGAGTWMSRTPGTPGAPNSAPLQQHTLATAADPALDD